MLAAEIIFGALYQCYGNSERKATVLVK